VTGAAGALGRHFSACLARAGAQVAALDVNRGALAALANEAGAAGRIRSYPLDVTNAELVPETIAAVIDDLSFVNVLINNAGIARDGYLVKEDERGGIVKMPHEQWQKVLDVDLTAPFLLSREIAAHMVARRIRPGLILHISSISRHGIAGQANYSAAKAALAVTARVWAAELGAHGIRVAAVAPGFVDPPLAMSEHALTDIVGRVPLGRLGTIDEVYAGVRFAIECEYFNGSCLEIDGGLRVG
jgi:3-oxoacyl-[acyl-carrier protein] reductase